MYDLRPYQAEAKNRAIDFFASRSKLRPILELPTASGKSVIIAHIARERSNPLMVLQPSKELLEQNFKKYQEVVKNDPTFKQATIYSASVGIKERGEVVFATIGSIYKHPDLFSYIDDYLIDECHEVCPDEDKFNRKGKQVKKDSMYVKFFKGKNASVLGLTATPYRMKTYNDHFSGQKYTKINLLNRENPHFFNSFLYNVTAREMYDQGYLCPINYIPLTWDGSVLRPNTTGAEFTEESVQKALTRNQILEKIPLILKQAYEKDRGSCLVFVQSVAEAKQLSETVPFSEYIHALTPKKDRERIISSFKSGSIKTLFNVGVLTRGFDYPALDTIILARPTMSLVLYVQIVGRGNRQAEGKEYCSFVDMCGNYERFGKIEELRVENDPVHGWVLRNDRKILSGVRMDRL